MVTLFNFSLSTKQRHEVEKKDKQCKKSHIQLEYDKSGSVTVIPAPFVQQVNCCLDAVQNYDWFAKSIQIDDVAWVKSSLAFYINAHAISRTIDFRPFMVGLLWFGFRNDTKMAD
jgi:hypothetical protein